MTQILGFRRKMQKKMVQIPTEKSDLSRSFAALAAAYLKMRFCHFPLFPRLALVFPEERICI